jgi:hypothetical protein
MESTPISPGTSTAPPVRRLLARLAAIALVAVSIPLATPEGPDFVVGGGRSDPGWLYGPLGVFGAGFVDRPMVYLCLLWLAIAIWIVVLVLARDLGMRWTAAVTGLLIVLFVLAPPLLSLDVFSYISYARLGAEHGLNPYEFAPSALPASDEAARQVLDYRDAVSVYGPLFTLGSYPLGALGVPFALWSLKAIAGAAIAVVVALVARLARLRGIEPAAAVAFVGLNPIVLVHLVGGAHNDGLTAAIAIAALAAALSARPALAGSGFVAAAAVKVSGLLYAPFALLGTREPGGRARLLAGAAAALLMVGAVSLLVFGTDVSEALSVAGGNQDRISRWSVPATLSRATGIDVDGWRIVLGAGLVAALAWLLVAVARGLDWVRGAAWASFGVLVASAYVVPWYLIWLLPVAAISRDRVLIGATILLTVFQAINGIPVSL